VRTSANVIVLAHIACNLFIVTFAQWHIWQFLFKKGPGVYQSGNSGREVTNLVENLLGSIVDSLIIDSAEKKILERQDQLDARHIE